MKSYRWIIPTIGAAIGITTVVYSHRLELTDWWRQRQVEPIPQAVTSAELTEPEDRSKKIAEADEEQIKDAVMLPDSINLDIPFTAQAPHGNWELPYQEACEEASAIMAARFLQSRSIANTNDANAAIIELVDYGTTTLGYPIDTTAAQTADIIEQFYGLTTELKYDWTWADIKTALTQGHPVLLPAAGRLLGNPYYTAPGPLYHMLVIKGYTATTVITNDSGTRRGADFQYSYATLEQANHDWNNGDVPNGAKVIIIVSP
ncbi:MAG: C39 family peptidase [Candidatus Kerfeldbacteria bacterium]|nr:C39 family peptidase [Candidatus Kerfeldbacteria bacterium]